ncbi:hypothetical protein ACGFIF_41115 [Kribbella sp. NPDC049174]|uniref:hypothetical protein n=1 Tax=Kribbella sp. NPDC049174 TaxID=3364112 RepID=UPI003722D97C
MTGRKQLRRSILAIATGFVLPLVLSRSADILLESTGVFPTVAEQRANGFDVLWMNILALGYRMAFGALGGYVTAATAPNRPARHVHLLAIITTAVAAVSNIAVATIPATANVLPPWFAVALVLLAYPSAWLGGRWHLSK